MHHAIEERRVPSVGLSLSVREHSAAGPGRPHLVLVHGYPDQQQMWDRVVAHLDGAGFHIITYDVRGAGGSDVPASRDGYRTELLVEDLIAVVGATVPEGEPFHLVGHDWGSVQLWDVVAAEAADARLRGRVASFTSISGPSLDHVAYLSRHHEGRRLRMLKQAVHSWYVYAFHVPVLPELVWNVLDRRRGRNAVNGLDLYRANMLRRLRGAGELRTDVPVQVLVPTRDKFVTDVMVDDLGGSCSNLTVVKIDAGHWVTRSHPGEVADLIAGHVRRHSA
jgi:pimeloyl-ACP methyl ester carboxylesterase